MRDEPTDSRSPQIGDTSSAACRCPQALKTMPLMRSTFHSPDWRRGDARRDRGRHRHRSRSTVRAGNDTINASALKAGQINLTINGGAGNDTIIGSQGNDLVNGGHRQRRGPARGGRRHVRLEPGRRQRHRSMARQAPTRSCSTAPIINENIDISANGGHARCSPATSAHVTMDLDNVETIDLNAKGGADTITVNDLTGTDVKQGQHRSRGRQPTAATVQRTPIVINATDGDDAITVTNNNGVVTVSGLGRRRDDLQLRGERSHRYQWPRRR